MGFGQVYEWKAPSVFFYTVDVRGAMTAKKITCDSVVATNYRGTWKGHDTTAFGDLARASTWTGRQTFADLITTDSVIGVTGDFSGKITGTSTMAITGASTLTGGVTIGSGGSACSKLVKLAGDSVAILVLGTDTFKMRK